MSSYTAVAALLGRQVIRSRRDQDSPVTADRRSLLRALMCSTLSAIALVAGAASADTWSPDPWLADLSQAKQAFQSKYANIEWLERDRGVSLDQLFGKAASRIEAAHSDADARAILERLIQRVADGHVTIDWPRTPSPPSVATTPTAQTDTCADLGFDGNRSSQGAGESLPGYRSVGEHDDTFPIGMLSGARRRVGVLRISGFEPQGTPAICHAALRALHREGAGPCNDACQDAVLRWSYDELTREFEGQIRRLRSAGAQILIVDLTGNGGGTEWAEAAARILTSKPITSEVRGFVRGPHWTEQWSALANSLRMTAAADATNREQLLRWAGEADRARRLAEIKCFSQQRCSLIERTGYATGLVGLAHAGQFAGESWADQVFSIAQFPYHDGVWSGPLIVLVDDQTWSAAEEFAAVLQDNRAAIILGTRTGGAGCGHTNGGTPTKLKNSGAILELPDCVRFRRDGSNEVAGIIPDVLTGMRASDGKLIEARLSAIHLSSAMKAAARQSHR